jgi:endoglucanase
VTWQFFDKLFLASWLQIIKVQTAIFIRSIMMKHYVYFSIFLFFALILNQSYGASVVFPTIPTFGKVATGQSKNVLIMVKNNTTSKVRLDSNWYTSNTTPYQITGGSCKFDQTNGFSLAGLQSCTLDIKFSPKVIGLQNNSLIIGYFLGTGWNWQESSLALTGEGVTAVAQPAAQPTPVPVLVPAPVSLPTTGTTGWLKVQGNKILNDHGMQVILKGVNIADPEHLNTKANERPNVSARSVALSATDQYFAQVIRLPILPGNPAYPNEGFFGTKNGWDIYFKNHLEPLVKELTAKGIYVIIDLHYVSDYQNLFPQVSAFWKYMAPKFNNNPHVIYEIFNEPILPDNWATWKNTIAQPVTNIIRSLAPNNLIFVGGPYWSSHITGAATDPVIGNNIVYIGHIYSNQTASIWDQKYGPVLAKYPLFISEWGFESGGTEGGDITYGLKFEAWMRANNLGWTVWAFDTLWGPRMFNSDWSLKSGSGGMGVFVRDLLIEQHLK